jgi:hypothetical protein
VSLSITTRGGARIQGTAEDLQGLVDLLQTALDCGHGFASDEAQIVLLGDNGKPLLPRRPDAPAPKVAAPPPRTEPELEVEQAPRIAPLARSNR